MSLTSGIENFYALEGKITISKGNFVVSVCQKNSLGNPLVFQKLSGIEKFYASEGYVTIFCRKFFVTQ